MAVPAPFFLDPSNLTPGTVLPGVQADYKIDKTLGSGMRGNTYLATATNLHSLPRCAFAPIRDEQRVVIKTVKLDEAWPRVEVLDFLSRVNGTLLKELLVLAKLKDLECVAEVYDYYHFPAILDDFPVHPMFIVQGFVPGDTLDQYVVKKWGTEFAGIRDAATWFQFASLIATNLISVHQREVVHRDIWPPNIMIGLNSEGEIRLSFIDFGDAVLRHELAAREPFIHDHPFKSPERPNDWLWPTRRADIYAVGGVLYFLATGQNPPGPIEDKDELKRQVLATISKRNKKLLEENLGIADVIVRCLRTDPTERIRDADDLLHEIGVFQAVHREAPVDLGVELRGALCEIGAQTALFKPGAGKAPDAFAAIAVQELRLLAHRLESMTHGVLDISGDHEEIVSGLTRYLSVLGNKDEYLAVTIPEFWSAQNLGINGRFLTMNKLLADRGVKISRLFLVTEAEWADWTSPRDPDRRRARTTFSEVADSHTAIQATLSDENRFKLYYKIVTEDVRHEYRKTDRHKGAWFSGGSAVTILPVYHNKGGRIRTVRMRVYEGKPETLRKDLTRQIEGGKPWPITVGLRPYGEPVA